MTAREKELRIKIGAECLHKKYRNDYLTACSEYYDFVRCPDDFECMEKYLDGFKYDCHNIGEVPWNCENCWKKFLRGEEC